MSDPTAALEELPIVTFERMALGPNAVGRLPSGKVVMTPGAAPGDRARVAIRVEHRGYVEADVVEVLHRSRDHREPPCRHARSKECGGCSWQHLDESAQRREKQAIIVREVGRVAPEATIRSIRTDIPAFGYRRRTKLGHRDGMLGYRRRGLRRIFDVWACPVLDPLLEAELDEIRERMSKRPAGNIDVLLDSYGRVVVGGEARTFRQPSVAAEEALIELVLEAIPAGASDVAELFAGVGTFTTPLLDRGHRVRAWEGDRETVKLLVSREPRVVAMRADLLKTRLALDLGEPDVVLLDPPRKGAAPCVPAIIASGARVLCYVSCAPMTLCRDVAALHKGGYRVDWVQPVDAFPQTEHIECVVRLTLSARHSSFLRRRR